VILTQYQTSVIRHNKIRKGLLDGYISELILLTTRCCLDSQFSLVGLWRLTAPSAIFHLYRGGQFYWWRNWGNRRKPPTCCKSL